VETKLENAELPAATWERLQKNLIWLSFRYAAHLFGYPQLKMRL